MKERGGGATNFFGSQQVSYMSPQQDYAQGKHSTDLIMQNSKAIVPFTQTTNLPGGQLSGNNSLGLVQFPPQFGQQNQMIARKKLTGSGVSSSNGGSEQRQMNSLADMVRTSNVIKQQPFNKKEGFPPIGNKQQEFISGTQFQKDFQLVAEHIVPKSTGNISGLPMGSGLTLSHNSSHLGKGQSASSSQITYSNTGISSMHEKASSDMGGGTGLSNMIGGGSSGNHFSHTSSRKNLEMFGAAGKEFSTVQQSNNQALQHLLQQSNNIYSTNRSVAAKAGQMQVLGTDKYSQLGGNTSQQQNPKFQSPAKSTGAAATKHVTHHSSASQQLENMMELQQMKTQLTQKTNTQKYTEYLNRFSTGSQNTQDITNLQLKYRDLRQQMEEEGIGGQKYQMMMMDSMNDTTTDNPSQSFNVGPLNKKVSPQLQKENRVSGAGQAPAGMGLGISGEQMHLEEKTFLKKMAMMAIDGTALPPNSQRQTGSNRKKQEFSLNARGFNTRGYRGEPQLAMQPKTRYDYVFIRMTDEQFEKEFADKIFFSRESLEGQSPSALSFKNKRISSMASTNGAEDQNPRGDGATFGFQISKTGKNNIRGSQDINRENNILSPVFRSGMPSIGSDDNQHQPISIQNHLPDAAAGKYQINPATPKGQSNVCSIISTNHTHIKVIANQGAIQGYNVLPHDQKVQQQTALNECVTDVMTKVQEKGRIVKTTIKKKYVTNALNPPNSRVASIFVIVLDNSVGSLIADVIPTDPRSTLLSDSSTSDNNNFSSTLSKLGTKVGPKAVFKKDQQIKELANGKPMKSGFRMRNNSTLNTKGYESESEVKSTNSTTTSSTLQQFIPTRNFEQTNGSATTKNSSRSLSQKGTQPRKNFQKKSEMVSGLDGGEGGSSLTPFLILKDPNAKKYPPTKIKILSPFDYTHHESHRINISLNNYNNFIALCFKNKGKINVNEVMKLGRKIGVPVSQAMFNDGFLKSREIANMLKEKLIAYLCKVINEENTPQDMPDNPLLQDAIVPLNQPMHQYKCYVGKGNNSILIRTLFKTRFWWLLHDKEEIEKVNFMWTQIRKNAIMDTFPCKFEEKKSGLKTHSTSIGQSLQTPGKMKQKKKMSNQLSNLSLESSAGPNSSNDKKESRLEKDVPVSSYAPPQNQVSQALQQLSVKLYNKLEDNFHLSNKKAMFLNIRLYYEAMGKDVFNAVPMTFHIKDGLDDPEFSRFRAFYMKEEDEIKKQKQAKTLLNNGEASEEQTQLAQASQKRNIWIVKPGENTNRGQGITVLKEMDEIKALISESTANRKRTCIVQKYIHNPLLINKRKFDIRLYAFMSSVNGNIKGYFYADGYLRTSCREFTLQNLSNRMIHLTNDAVQKYAEDYGKYEAGNKLSYTDFQNYIDKNYADLNISVERDLLPQMKKLVTDTIRGVYGKIDPKRRVNTFEIYGYDFMFDDDFKVYLIEVNTNPCLELGCPLLARLIPTMVENALRLSIDPLFPPPENWSQKKCVVNDICPENKFELIFDEKVDGPYLTELMKEKNNIIIEIDEEELSDNEFNEKDECEIVIS